MKKLIAAILILFVLIGAACAEVVTTGNVNLRTGPGLAYDVLTSVSEGKSLTYLKQTSIDDRGIAWYLVDHKGTECWISSVYSKVVGEAVAPAVQPTMPDLTNIQYFVELSAYYHQDLHASAAELAITNFAEVNSEVPNQYANENLTIAGYDTIEFFSLLGGEYTIYGAAIGMKAQNAAMTMSSNGLKLLSSDDHVMVFEHPAEEGGFDSCINVLIEDGVVTEIDWSTYTG